MDKIKKIVIHAPHLSPGGKRPIGLGDAVAAVAQPIAKAIDRVFNTKVQECGGCKQRQATLNAIMPDIGISR